MTEYTSVIINVDIELDNLRRVFIREVNAHSRPPPRPPTSLQLPKSTSEVKRQESFKVAVALTGANLLLSFLHFF